MGAAFNKNSIGGNGIKKIDDDSKVFTKGAVVSIGGGGGGSAKAEEKDSSVEVAASTSNSPINTRDTRDRATMDSRSVLMCTTTPTIIQSFTFEYAKGLLTTPPTTRTFPSLGVPFTSPARLPGWSRSRRCCCSWCSGHHRRGKRRKRGKGEKGIEKIYFFKKKTLKAARGTH